ncbi:hypothetical protein ACWKWU_10105 [Chitinophaga lutea]
MPRKLSLIALAFCLVLAACSDNADVQPERRFISMKLDGKVMLSEQRSAALYLPGDLTDSDPDNDRAEMLVSGYSYARDAINIHLLSDGPTLTPGVYTGVNVAMAMEMNADLDWIEANEGVGDLVVKIHQVQDSVVIGEFSGNLVSIFDGSVKSVRDGYFKMIYRKVQ